jgi:hypothetical protein
MKNLKDELKVEVTDGQVIVDRHLVESYDVEEYLREVSKLKGQMEHHKAIVEQASENLNRWGCKAEEAEKMWEEEMKKADAEADAAVAKHENRNSHPAE